LLPRWLAAVFAAVLLAVGPLGLLQVVAWTGMVFDYSARYGWAEGLERTFDGKNPCGLCDKIAAARQDRVAAESSVVLPPTKLVCLAAAVAEVPRADLRRAPQAYFLPMTGYPVRAERPASPPPRASAA
jgi:hypothetical protein